MRTLVHITLNLNIKLEMLYPFQRYGRGQKFRSESGDPDYAHLGVVCHPRIVLAMACLCTKCEDCSFTRFKVMMGQKLKLVKPICGYSVILRLTLRMVSCSYMLK